MTKTEIPMTKRERLVWRVDLAKRTVKEANYALIGDQSQASRREGLRTLANAQALLADHERALADYDALAEQNAHAAQGDPQ